MIIIRLTFFSRNRLDRLPAPVTDRFSEILATSVTNNSRDDVTGALLYDSKWFAQVIEGAEDTVSRTFERILRDPRHSDVSLVKMETVIKRRFGFRWMASAAWRDDNSELFRQYAEDGRFDPSLMRPDRLGELIEAAVAATATSQGRKAWTTGSDMNAA
jgi:hypothetical protein